MSFLITSVRRPGRPPLPVNTYTDPDTARAMAEALSAMMHSVTLTELDESGVPTIVARWENGKGKRTAAAPAVPAPVVIDHEPISLPADYHPRPVEDNGNAVAAALTKMREAAEEIVAATDEDSGEDSGEVYNAYCMKCHEKRDFHGSIVELANGSRAARGTCPVCGTSVQRMVKRDTPLSADFHTPDDEPETADEPSETAQDAPEDTAEGDEPDDPEIEALAETVTEAITEALPEGVTLPEVAVAVADTAVEFSHAAEEAAAEQPAKRAPRKRASRAKAKPEPTEGLTPDEEKARDMKVATCPNCGNRWPVKEIASGKTMVRYIMNHPGRDANGKATGGNCRGSLATVTDDML